MSNWPITSLNGKINIKHGFPFKSEYFSDEATPFIVLTPGNFYEEGGFKRQAGKERDQDTFKKYTFFRKMMRKILVFSYFCLCILPQRGSMPR